MSSQISIRLEERLVRRLAAEARRRKVRRSDLVREALRTFLEPSPPAGASKPYDRVRDLIGSLSGGPPDLGARAREHLAELIVDRR